MIKSRSGVNIPLEFNEQLAKELHKPIIRNFKKRTVCSRSRDYIWGADLADMQLYLGCWFSWYAINKQVR